MKWPPYLMKLGIVNEGHRFWLWIPLFLIGPIALVFLLAIFLIILPFALLALIFTWRWDWLEWAVMGVPAIFRVVCNLPGVKVDVDTADAKVYIVIY